MALRESEHESLSEIESEEEHKARGNVETFVGQELHFQTLVNFEDGVRVLVYDEEESDPI